VKDGVLDIDSITAPAFRYNIHSVCTSSTRVVEDSFETCGEKETTHATDQIARSRRVRQATTLWNKVPKALDAVNASAISDSALAIHELLLLCFFPHRLEASLWLASSAAYRRNDESDLQDGKEDDQIRYRLPFGHRSMARGNLHTASTNYLDATRSSLHV
jgi:hypothetical protein